MGWEQLRVGVELPFDPAVVVPELTEIELGVTHPPPVPDVERATRDEVVERFAGDVTPGMTVAVGGGSRGLTGRVELLRGTITGLRALGADPFVVPAMGSHGGATADGQRAMLATLGMTEDAVGAEIRSTMETEVVGRTADGRRLYLDRHAAGADRILPVNRIKPHTAFKGPVESGCTKMAVVGFGKQPGAAEFHASTATAMRDHLLAAIAVLRDSGRLLGGVGSVESPFGDIVTVRAMRSGDVGGVVEQHLTDEARALVAPLPFDDIDVLIIERGGKDISGTTLDPNVTGRFWIPDMPDPPVPRVRSIVLLGLTAVTGGNVLGIGFADFVPAALANAIDWEATYINSFTAGGPGVRRARLPMVLPDEEACIRAALSTCGKSFDAPKRVVRIESTLHLTRCWVSDALLGDLPARARVVGRRLTS
ncbi:MAG: lactate racemase domain-containing protein [Ilumatobacteraceae bacterium]